MKNSQYINGRAFEYGLTIALSENMHLDLTNNHSLKNALDCFLKCSTEEQRNIKLASKEVAKFILSKEFRFSDSNCSVFLQSDQMGEKGDVRDIVLHHSKLDVDIGISAKNRHYAIKHSRLSHKIDFGLEWFNTPCSTEYFHTISPIFKDLQDRRNKKEKWEDIIDKFTQYYVPILQAFQNEIKNLSNHNPTHVARELVQYLLGRYDFYKIIKSNGNVEIISFNITGALKWGKKIPLPSRIINISMKPKSKTTLLLVFDQGWQISFRLHNARTLVEPSLKFDINIIGCPATISRHVTDYK